MADPARKHATLGGSSSHQWVNCPGSHFYKRELPPEGDTKYTIKGNKAHEIAEILLDDFLNNKLEGTDPDIRAHLLTGSEPELLEWAHGYVEALWENVLEKSITGKFWGLEEKFTLSKDFDMWGFSDFWAVMLTDRAKRRGVIVDYKSGYQEVELEENSQIAFYACAMQEEFTAAGKKLDEVLGVIYQPLSSVPYKQVLFSAKNLEKWKGKFLAAGAQIFVKQKPKFKVGHWCKNCKAQAICTTYNKKVISKSDLALVDIKDELPVPERLDDKVLGNIILHSDALTKFIKACKQYGMSRFLKGDPISGTKVVRTSEGKRSWKKGKEVEIAERLQEIGIENPYANKLRGLGEIKTELKTLGFKASEADEYISEHCEKSAVSLAIVPESDKRVAVVTSDDLLLEIEESE